MKCSIKLRPALAEKAELQQQTPPIQGKKTAEDNITNICQTTHRDVVEKGPKEYSKR